jgi:hypothetical protein
MGVGGLGLPATLGIGGAAIGGLGAALIDDDDDDEEGVLLKGAHKPGTGDDLSHGQYEGPEDLEPMARMEPQELGDEEDLESFEEGDLVEIDMRVGGGKGEVVEMSPNATHAIIELSEDMEDGLSRGDRVAVHISDMSIVNGEEEPVDVSDLDPGDDVPYESANVEEASKVFKKKGFRKRGRKAAYNASRDNSRSNAIHKQAKKEEKDIPELENCGCGGSEVHDHGAPKVRVRAVKIRHDDLMDDEGPKIKVIKKKSGIPSKIIHMIKGALGLESATVKEEYDDEIERDDHARSTAGLASFSSEEDAGWSADEVIDWHSKDVIAAGAEWLDQELLDAKVNSLEDIHPDLLDDLAGMVIHDMQKAGKLPKRLDYNEYLDERDEYKQAIEDHLGMHFDEMVDHAEDKAVARGDRPPADYGVDEFPEGDIERVPADKLPLPEVPPAESGEPWASPGPESGLGIHDKKMQALAARRGEAAQKGRPTSHPSFDEPSFGTDY